MKRYNIKLSSDATTAESCDGAWVSYKDAKKLEYALKVAVVAMSSVWPDDFFDRFGGERFQEILEETRPTSRYRIQDFMFETLYPGEEKGDKS
jgi:hypothetical protein